MNANAELWVQALESGEYKQGQKILHDAKTDSWCCLGIGCDVYRKAGNEISTYIIVSGPEAFDGFSRVLPHKVAEWLGLSNQYGAFGDKSLTELNDSGATFAEIAALIRQEPEGLFVTEAARAQAAEGK